MINSEKPAMKIYKILSLSIGPLELLSGIGLFLYSGSRTDFRFISAARKILEEYKQTDSISGNNVHAIASLIIFLAAISAILVSVTYDIKLIRTIGKKVNGFNEIKTVRQSETEITYGIINGNNTIVFIKAGVDGTCYGEENKYLMIARKLNKKHKCTVITASNPNGYQDDFDAEMKFLHTYASNHKWMNYQIYYMGHSNGASLGMLHAYNHPEIKKLVCINGPLMIDPKKLIKGIESFNGDKMYLIYGSKDPSYNLVKIYEELESDKVEFVKIQGASHNFTGHLDLFMNLPGFLFFGDGIRCKGVQPNH